MIEENGKKFNINDSDVINHAPIVYNAIQEYYARIDRLVNTLDCDLIIRQEVHTHSNLFGILPGKDIIYEESLLNNEPFKVSVIYHLCFSNVMECNLSWEAYSYIQDMFKTVFMKRFDEDIGVDSIMLRFFKVNPKILPKSYLTITMKIDEFNKAVAFICEKLSVLKSYNDGFSNYDDYFDYMKDQAIKITNECNDKGFYSTYDIDRFTYSCISNKMRIHGMDLLYDINEISSTHIIDIDDIKIVQEKEFKRRLGNDAKLE